ncbi:hypothetical protein GCM10023115_29680 [Pontixanthobacter gangjinensis]|uniref:Glycosyltransferase family 4 protein n=1 Tax=Christiangramia aestuarii TaxID=1028746 RepID=A0A7K1LNT0_9FLAO|nr:glycosyltransferase family 4 protein [Christiangramia aestuarii]MUP42200.1 glycosyltransferase family 4 protein [Christiangramia aestuarii]
MSNTFKIGLIASTHLPKLGGMQIVNHLLAQKSIRESDLRFTIMSPVDGFKSKDYGYDFIKLRKLSYVTHRWYLEQIKWFSRYNGFNILHGSMLNMGGYLAMKASQELNKPCIVHSHGGDVQVEASIGYGATLQNHVKERIVKTINYSDKIIAVSSLNKNNIIELGANPDKVEIIHNPVLAKEISEVPFQDMRIKYKISPDEFVIMTLGRNHPVKRMKLLFKAIKKLKHLRIKCICIGPKGDYERLLNDYNIKEQVILTGMIPSVPKLQLELPNSELINTMKACDIFVSTSYVEAFSGAALEALACGIPIVVGKKHGVCDVIEENMNGYFFNDQISNPDNQLANLLESLYYKRSELNNRSLAIAKSVANLTVENSLHQLSGIYHSTV